jgi:PAS domain S-box-containing protein
VRAWRTDPLRSALANLLPFLLLAFGLAALGYPRAALAVAGAGPVWTSIVLLRRQRALAQAAIDLHVRADTLQGAFDAMSAAVIVVDENGKTIVFNPTAEMLLGVGSTDDPPSEWSRVYGTHRADGVTPLPWEELPIVRAMRGVAVEQTDLFVRNERRDGFWLSAAAKPVRDADGELRGAVLVCHDVTERRQTEEEIRRLNSELESRVRARTASLESALERLRQEGVGKEQIAEALRASQRQLQDIVDYAPAVIFIKDLEGRYLLVNAEYERVIGVGRRDTIGRSDLDLLVPEAATSVRRHDRRVIEDNDALEFEELILTTQGWRTFLSLKFPLHDAEGQPYGLCGIATDITERKRIEAELRRSEAALSALIENTTDAVWSIDREYRVVTMNASVRESFTRLYSSSLQKGLAIREGVPESVRDEWRQLYDRALAGERISVEQAVGEGDSREYHLISLSPIREGDEITGATAFSRDITEVRRAEDLARRNQAELNHVLRLGTIGEISSGLAHEINQPLGAIANFAGACVRMLDAGTASDVDLRRGFGLIAAEALRAGNIIRSLRDLARKADGQVEAVDINEVVQRASSLMQPEARLQGISLCLEAAPAVPPVHADGIQIEQVVLNLILNAIEAMHGSPVKLLSVRTSAANGHVQVAVDDSGAGLSVGVAERLFEPFFTTKEKGLGMGLAISRRIVEAHGGRLWGAPNDAGGSTFAFTLPVASD